jgi:nickel-dependent lactate racemase
MIEKVIINVTLKAGKEVWEKGAILTEPLPPDVLNEIYRNTGNVSVINGDQTTQTKLTFVAKRVKEGASSMTTMVVPKPEDSKPKPKLRRR